MAIPDDRIYLDYNATAPVYPEVVDVVSSALRDLGNASSVHAEGRSVRGTIEDARDSVSNLIGLPSQSITFTSGGTEANTTVIRGLLDSGAVSNVYCSAVEHPSVLEYTDPQHQIPVDEDGQLDLGKLEDVLKQHNAPFLLCVMLTNNETGVIQPVREASDLVHERGGLVLCDAVQGPGKLAVDFNSLGADFLTFSAHKIGGPQGVGCFATNTDVALEPVLIGGGQEKKRRSGTENAAGIAGYGAAARITAEKSDVERVGKLRDRMEAALLEARPDVCIFGQNGSRISNTTNIAIPGISSERQLIKLDLAGFSVSAGSACSSGKVSTSHVLLAMGASEDMAQSAIRISIGVGTSWHDLEKFVAVWATL
ncbi:MAG: cysteine desulfurase [Rhodospirillaceae bacterium]|jgi:cysteine desulfurase|nr:cysteine desulfurase [Rhodospirillaceae bacterium]MBT5566639.1 cysteine desulfurase [Rhodospirillaceae bacterium]MBT6087995.1 cysteine desulfurase [Rhodospirillaceae bacterium]MBT7450165.1 cysteine desulfurase [Rhodospirillaceae bacterium]